jgi:hypothetical protein
MSDFVPGGEYARDQAKFTLGAVCVLLFIGVMEIADKWFESFVAYIGVPYRIFILVICLLAVLALAPKIIHWKKSKSYHKFFFVGLSLLTLLLALRCAIKGVN